MAKNVQDRASAEEALSALDRLSDEEKIQVLAYVKALHSASKESPKKEISNGPSKPAPVLK